MWMKWITNTLSKLNRPIYGYIHLLSDVAWCVCVCVSGDQTKTSSLLFLKKIIHFFLFCSLFLSHWVFFLFSIITLTKNTTDEILTIDRNKNRDPAKHNHQSSHSMECPFWNSKTKIAWNVPLYLENNNKMHSLL